MASVLACESRSRRPVAVVSRPTWPALLRRHRCSSVERADTSDSSVDWWPPGTGPGERGYSARLLPGPGQHDELPGAACVKNIAASCSERHRSADRYLNAGHSRPSQAHPSTRPRRQARSDHTTSHASPAGPELQWSAGSLSVKTPLMGGAVTLNHGMGARAGAQAPRWSRYSRPSASQCRASAAAS